MDNGRLRQLWVRGRTVPDSIPSFKKPRSKKAVDVGILTIRDDEFRAVLAAFPEEAGIHTGRRDYTLRYAAGGEGSRYTLAVVRQVEQGNGEAQEAARDLLDDLNPSLLLVVGIAAGLPSDDITLGDVVLSTRVNDYSVEARKANSEPTYNLSGGPVAKAIAAKVANLAGRERDLGDWTARLPNRPAVDWKKRGQLYGSAEWQQELREKLEGHFGKGAQGRKPRFMAGAIASSDRLVKDPKILFPWVKTARHLLAIEMESGGVYRAARERCAMLAIRGISDLVGLKRNEAWTKYACLVAAEFARAFLRTGPVRPRSRRASGWSKGKQKAEDTVEPAGPADVLYTNLFPLLDHPKVLYVARSTCGSVKQAWARLRPEGRVHTSRVPRAWILHGKTIYSFVDPETHLGPIVDVGSIEEHGPEILTESDDRELRVAFVWLLNEALRDDLGAMGVRFFFKDKVFAFAGRLDEPPRKYKYQNVRLQSTMTVVSHYSTKPKTGSPQPFLRHNACQARFRLLDGRWYLEVTPTYRFTTNGRDKFFWHEESLSGIKRLEGNRAVLSQVLLWNDLVRTRRPGKLLTFGDAKRFELARAIPEGELFALESDRAEFATEHGTVVEGAAEEQGFQ